MDEGPVSADVYIEPSLCREHKADKRIHVNPRNPCLKNSLFSVPSVANRSSIEHPVSRIRVNLGILGFSSTDHPFRLRRKGCHPMVTLPSITLHSATLMINRTGPALSGNMVLDRKMVLISSNWLSAGLLLKPAAGPITIIAPVAWFGRQWGPMSR